MTKFFKKIKKKQSVFIYKQLKEHTFYKPFMYTADGEKIKKNNKNL